MFGKSIANGHAFSLIAGKKDIMNTSKKLLLVAQCGLNVLVPQQR